MTTRDEVLAMARDAGFAGYGEESGDYTIPVSAFESRLERFHALAVAKEREECAKVCEAHATQVAVLAKKSNSKSKNILYGERNGAIRCRDQIRARSAK